MKLVEGYRASKVLYNFLKSNDIKGTFLIPCNVCEVVPLTFHLAGIKVIFVDISKDTLCIDLCSIRTIVNECTGLLYVHTYGVEATPINLFRHLKRLHPSLIIIDDCCPCMPILEGTLDYSIDLRLFSLRKTKQVNMNGAIGIMQDKFSYMQVETVYDASADETYSQLVRDCYTKNIQLPQFEFNFLDNISFEFNYDLFQVKKEESIARKRKINSIYRENLPPSIQLKDEFQKWRFNILVENPKFVLHALFNEGLFASSHFTPKANIWNGSNNGENSTFISEHIVNLFNDEFYSVEKAISTCNVINKALQSI